MLFQKKSYLSFILASSFIVTGCTTNSAIETELDSIPTPKNWSKENVLTEKVNTHNNTLWLKKLITPELQRYIEIALENNRSLKQDLFDVEIAEQSVIVSGATLWPSLDLNLSTSKRDYSGITTSNDLSLSLQYEFDIWGKLGAAERQVNLSYAALLAQYEQQKRELISDVILGWYQVIEQEQQLSLAQKSLKSIEQNLSIIEAGYNSGLNTSLDVYLARNDVASERSKVATEKTTLQSNIRALELLLGKYPSAALQAGTADIPELSQAVAVGVPSEVVANNPELQYMWNLLLAEDAGLAYAHKQRFPSLSLTASTGTSSTELSDLLSSDVGWSLLGNLTAPIFNAGRLAANEESARLETKQAEQAYLETLFSTFSTIENSLTEAENLQLSYQANIDAADNATLAEEVSFEQYLKGLVSYTTVLDAQSRAYTAQSSVIQLKYEMLNTRLQLFTALGGNFSSILSKDVK
ncbi:TolC family protein [uncultured Psychrosphaera sp.]|uniref:TolC family protein n=1 Tax=uncultured Psychrosphaera sp. TaxID=1403522 RepID=UPI00262CB55D|nr:TolC family protein [uncultured Psychrosphaera sp.]